MIDQPTLIVVALADPYVDTSDIHRLRAFLGTQNTPWEKWGWHAGNFCKIGHGKSRGGLFGKLLIFSVYAWWAARICFKTLFHRKPALYYCLMLEGTLPVAVASLFRNVRFVFANMDNAPLVRNWSPWQKRCIEALERFVANRAVVHILPQEERWHAPDPNVRFIMNTPCKPAFRAAEQIAHQRGYKPNSALTIYALGWLGNVRGFDILVQAIRNSRHDIRVILAGEIACPEAEALAQCDFCEYLGPLPHEEALAHYARVHLVFSYYDPSFVIDRLASSGKWAECILNGVPFLVNSEVQTAQKFRDANACFSVPYHDVDGLTALLDRLAVDRDELTRVANNLARFRVGFWDENMAAVLQSCGLSLDPLQLAERQA